MKKTPLYECEYCYKEHTLPADKLRVMTDGKRVCQDCYEDEDDGTETSWLTLPPFVPEHEREITFLKARVAELEAACRQALAACREIERQQGEGPVPILKAALSRREGE